MEYNRIFISHHSKDLTKAEELRDYIEQQDYLSPILVVSEKKPNELFEKQVEEGIRDASYFVPILTKNTLKSIWVNQEIGFARGVGRQTYALIDDKIVSKRAFKGFIHKQHENFIFEQSSFKLKYIELIDLIKENEGLGEPKYFKQQWECEGDKAENFPFQSQIDENSLLHIRVDLIDDSQEFVIYFQVGSKGPKDEFRYIGFSNSNKIDNSADLRGLEYVFQFDLPGNTKYKKTLNIVNAIKQSGLFFETFPNSIRSVRVRNMNGKMGSANHYYYSISIKK